jgi:hypothetical protein
VSALTPERRPQRDRLGSAGQAIDLVLRPSTPVHEWQTGAFRFPSVRCPGSIGRGNRRRHNGFTASDVAARVRALSKQTPSQYGPRHAAYDLKKLRGKQILRRIAHSRRYEPLSTGLRAMTALLVLRNKAIKPLLAAAQPLRPPRGAHNPKPIDAHYDAIQAAMKGVFHELGLAA